MVDNKNIDSKARIYISIYHSMRRMSLIAVSVLAAFELLMIVFSVVNADFYGPYLFKYRLSYILFFAIAVSYLLIYLYADKDIEKRYKGLLYASIVSVIFAFAWALRITSWDAMALGVVDPILFMTICMAVPIGFYVPVSVYSVLVVVSSAVMLVITSKFGLSVGSSINFVIFLVTEIILGITFIRLKTKLSERIVEAGDQAGIDAMTGFGNRRTYMYDMTKLESESEKDDLACVSIDINGLKDINDSLGHESGDRIIIGAADCIRKCLGNVGKIYRVGGDEFVAFVFADKSDLDKLSTELEKQMSVWSEQNGLNLSASLGYAYYNENREDGLKETVKTADKRMYSAKAEYYRNSGRDRRKER